MDNGKTVGMILFIGGEELIESLDFISGVFIGLILIGLIVLIISIIFEQRRNTKETMKDIKKEDLEP